VRYQEDLQVMLRDRLRRLMTTEHDTYAYEVALITEWMVKQPAIRALLEEIATEDAEISVDEWAAQIQTQRGLFWPTTSEAGRANLVWRMLRDTLPKTNPTWQLADGVSDQRNVNAMLRDFTERVVTPFFDFLGERIGAESSVLYLLERYVRRVEWFDRDTLYKVYDENTRQGERVYDIDLRRFLFDQGLNMPFSQSKSASGLSDVLGELDTDDPLVCEVKLFDAGNHGKRELAVGLNQVVNYAHDYGKGAGYLVVINLSGRPLELPHDGEGKTWPPFTEVGGVRVYLIAVRALPTVSASKLGKANPVTVTRDELVDPDA
jgi:hypothetical protein